ncbi:acetyl-CoA carboxylase biotin carboxylase subunit [Lentilactobacillus curieae]|uniref:biotin carboxylase n=1 Tax=Lentilactobacillus curieae TaxID=1138822 RepID=A0A1S6QH39_9LACO|nr:acetyl-CoA carboxylase biotin carboxylase subunit [Lentilactobacillus curieae]AQW20928.1 acetyl-CoA carboxylase biotin carboxylase subunit [Lentilactobacillus curieae]
MVNRLFASNNPVSTWPFHKILIANRGEIAVRIIQTCRYLGIPTVAVYSTADRSAMHVKLAGEAVCIGPPSPTKSYLNIAALITAAKQTGADAIHPGYGFLSESSEFSEACAKEKIKFIGAKKEMIDLLGDKERARATMKSAGLPIVKGSSKAVTTVEEALIQADEIGFPIMLKASSGGGGKGMRIIESREQLKDNFSTAQDEAISSFNDNHMYLEQYLATPRHIEVQIIADQYGNVTALGERDCTIQARHQKVLEEAPAVVLKAKTRKEIFERCENAVEILGYEGLGTIEFLYNPDGSYYFMEMNTRIQVEHPITELTTRTDLVQMQLEVAAGAKLNKRRPQKTGFALECRINAFTPGKITGLHLPTGHGVRVDTAIYQGYSVPANYDSMIAKLIVFGRERKSVIRRMITVLDETVIDGIETNLDQLVQILEQPEVQKQTTNVNWLDQKIDGKE